LVITIHTPKIADAGVMPMVSFFRYDFVRDEFLSLRELIFL
jgi:hypothetical protein